MQSRSRPRFPAFLIIATVLHVCTVLVGARPRNDHAESTSNSTSSPKFHHQPRQAGTGPVISSNFQDPCIIQVGDTWYAFSGPNGNPGVNVQVATSTDFSAWDVLQGYDALPQLGSWAANPGHVWAPDANQLVCVTVCLNPLAEATFRSETRQDADQRTLGPIHVGNRQTASLSCTTRPSSPRPHATTASAWRFRRPSRDPTRPTTNR